MEHGSKDYLDILIEYLEEDRFDRQIVMNSLYEVTGYRYPTKEEWLIWFKRLNAIPVTGEEPEPAVTVGSLKEGIRQIFSGILKI
jgi:hypothetical protein